MILRNAHHLHSDNDEEFRQLSLYIGHNRSQRGQWKVGDQAEGLPVMTIDREKKFIIILSST